MRWRKLGRVFEPDNEAPWMVSHAANPTAETIDDTSLRIYFGCRDKENRSHIGSVDICLGATIRVSSIAETPHVCPGPLGSFDDSGVSMGWLVATESTTYLYYLGWNLGVTVPWRNSIGLAIRKDSTGCFEKYSPAPLVDRSAVDPFSLSYPCVHHCGARWRMWYGSHLRWGAKKTDMEHVIKYAESDDGILWQREGVVCIDFASEKEYGVSRPCVIRDPDRFRMWYSYRDETYRIGYAESDDGVKWRRKDGEVGIGVSDSGWDSEMIEYPYVFDYAGERYLLYNGNSFGRTGFGLAVLEQD